jgi:hypothetical protein
MMVTLLNYGQIVGSKQKDRAHLAISEVFKRDGEVEGRATNSNSLRLKVREQIEGEGLSGPV